MQVLLNGARGRLGREIESILQEKDYDVVPLGKAEVADAVPILSTQARPYVFLDVSLPEGTLAWARAFRELGDDERKHCRGMLIGTTGFDASGLQALQGLGGTIPWALVSNFSAGVHLFEEMLKARTSAGISVADLARNLGFDLAIWESHHTRKLDAPSGTAKTLAGAAGIAPDRVSATRVGMVVGEHILFASADSEELRIQHIAHTRRLFARGAVEMAARLFAANLSPGRYEKAEILSLPAV